MVENLKGDESRLTEKLAKKQSELSIIEKRVKSLQSVRPPFMDELERLQAELEFLYKDYVTKYRNLNYLESELERYYKVEESRAKESRRVMQKMRDQIKDEELKHMMDADD
jgi:clusterin-associated protein 1